MRSRIAFCLRKDFFINTKSKALAIAGAAADKKGMDIVIADMRKMSSIGSYFVITSGSSTTQVKAIAEHIEKSLKEKGERLLHSECAREALWILLDFGDVIAHVFLEETRRFYDLERLWSDAPQERFKEPGRKPAVKSHKAAKARSAKKRSLKPKAKKRIVKRKKSRR